MARHVKQYLEPLLARVNATVSDKVKQLVYELLPSGRCSVRRIASSIGMDRRTLHRHLTRDGETFSSIVDTARADLAQRYVEDRGRSLKEVAYLLGFSRSSAFSRWFRERFGCSPTSWRAADHDRAESQYPVPQHQRPKHSRGTSDRFGARGRVKRQSPTITEQFTVAPRATAWRIFRILHSKSNRIACFRKDGDFSHGLGQLEPIDRVRASGRYRGNLPVRHGIYEGRQSTRC
jgi:AraC-like DNA-binding protein